MLVSVAGPRPGPAVPRREWFAAGRRARFPWAGAERLADSPERVSVVWVEGKRRVPVKHQIAAGEDEIEWIVLPGSSRRARCTR
ncbi:hypothetical protein [Nannocystis pusilla]|uniref:hypothetical protein n=1 Tax=Nannocystis pusilla TaxID=889268 RepID=UPI003B7CC112